MNRIFALAAAAAATALSTSCVIVTDVQPGDYVDAQFSLTWHTEVAGSSLPFDCHDSGANTVVVESTNTLTDDVFVDLYDCGDEHGLTQTITAGDYFVDVSLAYCDADANCYPPMVGETVGVIEVYDSAIYELGDFVFVVD